MSQRFRPEVAGPMTGSATSGDDFAVFTAAPGCRCAHPGYKRTGKKERAKTKESEGRGTPADAYGMSHATRTNVAIRPRFRAWRGLKTKAAHLPAFRNGAHGGEPTPPLSSRRTSWDVAERRALSVSACPSPATKSQTGHDAGRAYSRSRPGARCVVPPAGTALAPPPQAPPRRCPSERDDSKKLYQKRRLYASMKSRRSRPRRWRDPYFFNPRIARENALDSFTRERRQNGLVSI